MSAGSPPPERHTERPSESKAGSSPEGPFSREELREYTGALIRELAAELAGEIVRQISASPEMRAMLPYKCTGNEYICTHTYTCSDLKHRCEKTFRCPGTYACNDIHVGYGQAFFR
jgi:hypothetical protein